MKMGIIILTVLLSPILTPAQGDLGTAIGKGDIATISSYLADRVELTIGTDEAMVSRSEAETKLRTFYAAHAPKGFKMMHSGNSKSQEANYNIGELSTDKGMFRVYLYFTQEGAKRVVTELRFEQ